jgi:lysophospholipase L1-like esterase
MTESTISSKGAENKVVFFGSSSIAGKGQAFDLIGELQKRPANSRFSFLNFGVGGDLAYNALQRVPEVVAAHPDRVFIMLGGNDILASVFQNVWQMFRRTKHLPQAPSPEWFDKNLRSIVRELKSHSIAKIALVSLPQVGEAPTSTDAHQRHLNILYEEYARIIKQIADDESAAYVPFYEKLHDAIVASPGRTFTSFSFSPFYRDTFRYFILRKTGDQIAEANGWKFHVDGVHLNSRGGRILADSIQELLDG